MSLNKPSHSLVPRASTRPTHSLLRTQARSRSSRFSPYPRRQYSVHQLRVTHVDPNYVQGLVEIIMPEHPAEVLAALLIRPPRGLDQFLAEYIDVGHRLVVRAIAVVINLAQVGFGRAGAGL